MNLTTLLQRRRSVQILAVLLLAVYCLAGIRTALDFVEFFQSPGQFYMFDFRIYERALQDVLARRDPYADQRIGTAFLYPPPSLVGLHVFSLVPAAARDLVFHLLNLALLFWMVRAVQRAYQVPFAQAWWWYVVALFYGPTLETLTIGQINIVTLAGITLMFAWEKRQPALAGLGLGLAILTKISPLLFLGYLVFQRSWRVLLWAGLSLVGLSLLTGWLYGFQHFAGFLTSFFSAASFFDNTLNIQGLAAKLSTFGFFPPEFSPQFQWLLSLYIGMVLFTSAAANLFLKEREPFFVVAIFCMVLYPNIAWYHHYLFFLLPIFILLAWSRYDFATTLWVILFLLIIQIDRYRLTTGLLIHGMGHATLLALLAYQLKRAVPAAQKMIRAGAVS